MEHAGRSEDALPVGPRIYQGMDWLVGYVRDTIDQTVNDVVPYCCSSDMAGTDDDNPLFAPRKYSHGRRRLESECRQPPAPYEEEEHEEDGLVRGNFLIEIQGGRGTDSGMEYESDDERLIVARLGRPLQAWNELQRNEPTQCVMPGDRVVRVNGTEGDCRTLVKELRQDRPALVMMRRARHFEVSVQRKGNRLGMNVAPRRTVLKVSFLTEGVIQQWNRLHVDRAVELGDRIIEVNGMAGDAQLMTEMLVSSEQLHLKLVRPR